MDGHGASTVASLTSRAAANEQLAKSVSPQLNHQSPTKSQGRGQAPRNPRSPKAGRALMQAKASPAGSSKSRLRPFRDFPRPGTAEGQIVLLCRRRSPDGTPRRDICIVSPDQKRDARWEFGCRVPSVIQLRMLIPRLTPGSVGFVAWSPGSTAGVEFAACCLARRCHVKISLTTRRRRLEDGEFVEFTQLPSTILCYITVHC